jgi:hypothetical protein
MKAQFLNNIMEKITDAMGIEQGEGIKNTTTYILAGMAITLGIIIIFLIKQLTSKY